MSSVNQVFLVGRLGADPEMRYTPQGTAVCRLRLATNRRGRRDGSEAEDKPDWHRVIVWDKLGELCHRFLRKGRLVAVVGRIRYDMWTGKDGTRKHSTEIVANEVQFLGSREGDAAGGSRGYGYGGAPPAAAAPAPVRPLVAASSSPMGAGDDLPF